MSHASRWGVLAAAVALTFGCAQKPAALESDMAAAIPADTLAVASLDLDRVRSSELFRNLPPDWALALATFRGVSRLLVTYNGRDILAIGGGEFTGAPPGTTLVTPRLILAGSLAAVRAAKEQHSTGHTGAEALLAQAPANGQPLWAVVRGGTRLPLRGNSANLNRLIHFTQFTTVSAMWDGDLHVDATGRCTKADDARELEETLRALLTVGRATAKNGDLSAMLQSVQLEREETTVKVRLDVSVKAIEELLR